MYSAMLVEDEDDLRDTYKAMKTWGRNGFSITSEAENGVRALELLEKVSVDVVFTDIRMPLMDGITLMKQAAEKYPGLLFVFVSAHHNFEYAREGIHLGAVDYLVKPVLESDLEAVLSKVCTHLRNQNKNGMNGLAEKLFQDSDMEGDLMMVKLCDYLWENIHRQLTMEDVAEVMGMNKDYIGRRVKLRTGHTFRNFYNQIKMEYAKQLIKQGTYKVYEVSDLLGYASPDHFSQIFKSVVQMTPASYKKLGKV